MPAKKPRAIAQDKSAEREHRDDDPAERGELPHRPERKSDNGGGARRGVGEEQRADPADYV